MLSCLCVNHLLSGPEGKHSGWRPWTAVSPKALEGKMCPTAHTESAGRCSSGTFWQTCGTAAGAAPSWESSSPQVFAMISFDDFNLAGWQERRSVHSCPPSYSLIKIIAFSLLERTFTPQSCFQSSVMQMSVPILPPSMDCSGSAVTQAKSPSLSLSVLCTHCFTAWKVFTLFP